MKRSIAGWMIAPLLLTGCASMDQAECLNADWFAIGLEDGARGRPLERLGAHRRACAEFGVAPQAERYMAGRIEGLAAYCTYERGYASGQAGHALAGVCPSGMLAERFGAGYRDGRERHLLTRQLAAVQKDIENTKAALKAGIAGRRERAREVERLEDLTREAERLEQAIAQLPAR